MFANPVILPAFRGPLPVIAALIQNQMTVVAQTIPHTLASLSVSAPVPILISVPHMCPTVLLNYIT